jgi:DNA polymerase
MIAWLAGQEDKLDAFHAYDAGTGPDLYVVAASGIYNVSIDAAVEFRATGKTAELALGFSGGALAFAKMAKGSGVRIAKLYDGVWANAEGVFKDQALGAWDHRGRKTGMSEKAWLTAEVIKLAWRAKNYRIAAYWKEVESAAIEAMKKSGEIIPVGKVRYRKVGSFLFCLLPSGRALCYPYPRLAAMVYVEEDGERIKMRKDKAQKEGLEIVGDAAPTLVFKSIDQFTKRWSETTAYGGHLVENITQASARDIMAEAMLRVDAAGYSLILTVHDELITEDDETFGSMDEFNALMTEVPSWAEGLPISVGGWAGKRYRK